MSSRTSTRISVLIVVLLAGLTVSCGNFGSFTFEEESDEIEVESQTGPLGGLLNLEIPMEVNLQQELQEQDASGAESVHLIDLRFEMTENTDQENFDFLDEIAIYAESENQPRELLAERNPVPEGQNEFEFDVDDELDLKPYAEEGITLETEASGSAPGEDVRFKAYAEFRVHVL